MGRFTGGGGFVLVNQDPWINLDGRLGAAQGGVTPLAGILNVYPVATPPNKRIFWSASSPNGNGCQPPWHVAGVDYPIGIRRNLYPTNASLSDPATGPSSGPVSFDTTAHICNVNSSNQTIQGWDFSLEGGWRIAINPNVLANTGNTTITDCNFRCGTNGQRCFDSNSTLGTTLIQYCEFDGNNDPLLADGSAAMFTPGDAGTVQIQWCYIHDIGTQAFHVGSGGNSGSTMQKFWTRYCVIINTGTGGNDASGHPIHGDWVEGADGTSCTLNNIVNEYCVWAQTTTNTAFISQGIGYTGQSSNAEVFVSGSINNNVFYTPPLGGNGVNSAIIQDLTWWNNTIDGRLYILQNYADVRAGGVFFNNAPANTPTGGFSGTTTETGNVSMVDGTTIT